MAKDIFTVSPNSLPKKKKAQDITVGAANIGSSNSSIKVERLDTPKRNSEKSVIGKEKTNNPITDKMLNKARAKGITKDELLKMQDDLDREDMSKEIGKYRKAKNTAKQYSSPDFVGFEDAIPEVKSSNENAEKEKQRLMDKYGFDSETIDNAYKEFDDKATKEAIKQKNEKDKAYAKAHPVLGSLKSLGANLMSPIEGIANTTTALQGGKIDPEKDFILKNKVEAQREGAKENIKTNAGKTAYDLGMSGADMLTQLGLGVATGGGSSLLGAIQGGQTANDMLQQSIKNGNSSVQAGLTALGGGTVGGLMAKGGMDVLTKNIVPKNILGNVAKGVLTEGAEEAVENLADSGIDQLASAAFKGTSNKKATINDYMSQGMTEDEAKDAYFIDRLKEVGTDFAAGGLFGGIAGGLEGANATLHRNNIESGRTNSVVGDLLNGKPINSDASIQNVDIANDTTLDKAQETPKVEIPKVEESKVEMPKIDEPKAEIPQEITPTIDENPEYQALFENISNENAGTGLDRRERNSDIFRTNPKNVGEKGRLTSAIARSLKDNNVFNDTKGVRHDLSMAFNEFAEKGTYESYQNLLDKAEQVKKAIPEVVMYEDAELGNYTNFNEIDSVIKDLGTRYPEISANMKMEQMKKVMYDPKYTAEQKSLVLENLVETASPKEKEILNTKYSTELKNVQDFLSNQERVESNYNKPTVETEPTQNLTTPDEQLGSGEEKLRSYPFSVDMPKELIDQLDNYSYRALTNAETKTKAEQVRTESKTPTEALTKFREMLGRHEAASVPLGYNLAQEMMDAGDYNTAVDIIDSIAEQMTRAGQFSQAAYITALRNDPVAVLTSLQKEIRKINESGSKKFKDKWKEVKLTDEEMNTLSNVKKGDTEALQSITDDIYARIAKDYPHKFWDYFYDTTKTFMLLNPRTHLRNIVANAVTMPVRSATDRVKSAMEIGYSLLDKNYKRTSSLTGGNKKTDAIAKSIWDNGVKDLVDNNGGKYEDGGLSRVQRESQLWKDNKIAGKQIKGVTQKAVKQTTNVFQALDRLTGGYLNEKTGIVDNLKAFGDEKVTGSALENLRQFDYWLLGDVEDTPFVKQNFINALSNYCKAQNITSVDAVPQEAINLAYDEALKATFKDDNALTSVLQTIKKKTGKFGDIAMPFTKTPANLAVRSFEYSPAGFIKSFSEFAKAKQRTGGNITNADISKFIGDLSKNVTGTGMIFLGYMLAKSGIITGDYSDNKNEKNWQKMQGYLPNAFHIGNKYYTYDWAQPSSISLIIGTAIYEGMKAEEEEENAVLKGLKSAGKGMINAGDAWFNLSPLQNVSEIMGGGDSATYGDNSITANILKTIAEYPQTLVPSVLGATARANDTTIRNTFDKTSYGNTYMNQVKAKIPGLSKTLPASYDVWGRERKRGSDSDAAFSQFVNPGTLGYYNSSDKDIDDYVQSIYNAVKDNEDYSETQVLPRQAEYSVKIDGKEKKLNNKEYSLRQKTLGETQRGLVRAFSKVAEEAGLTPEEQADALNKIYKAANDGTKVKLYGLETSLGSTEAEKYRAGTKEYANYVKDFMLAERAGLSYDQYMKKMSEGGAKHIEQYVNDKKVVDDINKQLGTELKVETYETYKERVPSLTNNDVIALETLKRDYDMSNNSKTLAALASMDATDEQRSLYLRMMSTDKDLEAGYVQRGLEAFGDSALYQIFLYKAIATKYDGKDNNSLSKKEIEAFVNDSFDTQEERDAWRYVLTTPKKKK